MTPFDKLRMTLIFTYRTSIIFHTSQSAINNPHFICAISGICGRFLRDLRWKHHLIVIHISKKIIPLKEKFQI